MPRVSVKAPPTIAERSGDLVNTVVNTASDLFYTTIDIAVRKIPQETVMAIGDLMNLLGSKQKPMKRIQKR